MTTNLTINQEVYLARHGNWNTTYTKGRIVKITPSGQVSVQTANSETPVRFTTDGKEIGGSTYRPLILMVDTVEVERRIALVDAQRGTNKLVADVLKVLADHRTGEGNYSITSEVKQELMKLVESL